ncbi:6,7,8-trihydroxycoumarin synthase-like [Rutidosis leptorrhynchoides]|uniref:6,7,8-trihydroxycoumarin synthase-like n=1 Tax=Rutidosis leptorrhynchoides TaxID=125765 RepID=UPI003A9A0A87
MEFLLQFLIVSFPLIFLLYLLPKIIKNNSRLYAPGPFALPFIGNLHQIDYKSLHTSLWNISKSYGPIVSLRIGFMPAIVVSSASVAKDVLKTQDMIFCSRPPLLALQKFSYNGIDVALSSYNKNWSEMRKIITIHLLNQKRVQSLRYIREDEVLRTMNKIHGLALSSNRVNLSELLQSATNNVMIRMSFGKRYEDGHEHKKILRLLDDLQGMITDFFITDCWPGLPFAGLIDKLTGKMGRLDKCFQNLDMFYQELIEEHLKPQNMKSNEEDHDIIDVLIQHMKNPDLNTLELTYNHIKAIILDILAAGTDTSAATLTWGMTTLIKHPEVMKKAQEEVRSVVGKNNKVVEDDLRKLTYLKAVIKEVMRLYPPTPLIPRETLKETILHGYKIESKTLVYINTWAIGRDPESWKDPEESLPERFLGSDIDFKGNNFELVPFGAGRRICPGMSVGVMVIELFLANLLYLFDWSLPDDMTSEDIDFETKPGLTMHKKNALNLLACVHH